MNAEIEKMLRIQELDAEARKLEKEIERYPGLRQARAEELARTRKRLEDAGNKRREAELQIREAERNVAELREELRKFTERQARVKSQKEYDALTHELSEIQRKISEEDEKGLELVTQEDQLDAEIAAQEKHLDRQIAEAKTESDRLNERESEKKKFLENLLEERGRQAALADPNLLQRYERLRGQYPANAIVPVQEGNCGGCFMRILPRTLQDLQRNDSLTECASCHRILYVP